MNRFSLVFWSTLLLNVAFAENVTVTIKTQDNDELAGAVVVLEPSSEMPLPTLDEPAVMDQVDRQFNPRILAVPKGSPVIFPNSDSIKHHVYSFSPAKVFELQLYRGSAAEPEVFNKAGVIELGCNVHDWMLGYIFVSDSPFFTQTETGNSATLTVPPGEYKVRVWHPRFKESDMQKRLSISVSQDTSVEFVLEQDLLPNPFDGDEIFDDFDVY